MRLRGLYALFTTLFCTASAFAAITGTVINSDGAPVSGAKVSLFAPETIEARRARIVSKEHERTPLLSLTTGTNGTFSLDTPKGQPLLDLRIEAAGFAPSGTRVLPDEDIGAQALVTAPAKSGTITAGGKPVAGATVVWIGNDTQVQTQTDENGKYSIPDPDKWALLVLVIHPDFAPIEEITIPLAGGKKGLDRTMTAGVALKGRVVGADGTTPAGKATILIDNWPAATSGDDGTFTVPHARAQWKEIAAVLGDRAGARTHTNGDVTLKLAKSASIGGTVRDARTQQAASGVELRLGLPGPVSIPSMTALTDAKGNFALSNVTPGIYTLNAVRPGFSTLPVTVSVTPGQTVQKNVYLNERARITGTVVDENKRPVSGTHLTTRHGGRERNPMMMARNAGNQPSQAAAAPDGRFVLRGVEPGTEVAVEATKRGLPSASSTSFKLAAGEKRSGVTVVIPHGVSFSGKVTDPNGKPLSGVTVEAAEAEHDGFPGAGMVRRMVATAQRGNADDQLVRSGTDGAFSMKLKEGKYDVVFKREGFSSKSLRSQEVSSTTKPVEVKLEAGVEITGRVSRAGIPVEGVNVMAISQDGLQPAQTLPDGSFRVSDLTPGSYMLSVNKTDSFIQTMRSVSAPARDVNIELPAGGRISGRVVDKNSHQPVTTFQAGVTTSRGGGGMMVMTPPMTRQFTSDDGSFTLENVPPGQTQLVVTAPGFTTGRVSGLNIEDGKSIADVEVGLDTGVKLVGRVTGPDGAPLSGVSIREDDVAGGGRMMRMNVGMGDGGAMTDPNGEYTIDSLEPGEKTFTFNRGGYLTEQKTVNLSGRETRQDVQLSSGQPVIGQVVSEAGGPVADATVSASSAAEGFAGFGGQRNAHTDASGNFTFEGLAPGHYTFSATKSGYAQGVTRDFDISAGVPVRVVMKSGGLITGHVSGLTDRDLATATVVANGATGTASAAVDPSGNYRIEGSPTGTVRLTARTGQMFGGTSKSTPVKTVQVDAGSNVTADLEFKSDTVIRGRVTRGGRPVPNALVAFMPRGLASRASTSTDNSGAYEMPGLDDATYNVQVVDLERITPFTTTYEVKGSGNFDIDITGAAVRGRVLNATTGAPVDEAHIEIRGTGAEGFLASRGAQTDGSGNFAIDAVAPGSYTASVEKTGFGNDAHDITVSTSDVDVQFKVAPSDGITLSIVDGRDRRPLAAVVTVYDMQGRQSDQPIRMGSPADVQLALSPGSYRITISAPGYATSSVVLAAPSKRTIPLTPGGTLIVHSKASAMVSAHLIDSAGYVYPVNLRGFPQATFSLDPSPHPTTVPNVAAGTYRLEVLSGGTVVSTTSVTVADGVPVDVTI